MSNDPGDMVERAEQLKRTSKEERRQKLKELFPEWFRYPRKASGKFKDTFVNVKLSVSSVEYGTANMPRWSHTYTVKLVIRPTNWPLGYFQRSIYKESFDSVHDCWPPGGQAESEANSVFDSVVAKYGLEVL